MEDKFKKHIWYYTTLILVLCSGFSLLFFGFDKQFQVIIFVSIISFYIVWTIMHHYLHHVLTMKIVLEYVLIGVLGFCLSLFLFIV